VSAVADQLRHAAGVVDQLGIYGDPLVPVRRSLLLAAADELDGAEDES
jgi:hypothetical protein